MTPVWICDPPAWEVAFEQAHAAAGDLTPEAFAQLREEVRLQFASPGQHVAYVEEWETGNGLPVCRRSVLAQAPSLPDLHERLAGLPSPCAALRERRVQGVAYPGWRFVRV